MKKVFKKEKSKKNRKSVLENLKKKKWKKICSDFKFV